MENIPNNTSKPMMQHRAIILSISLFVLIVLGMFVFVFIKQNEMKQVTTPTPDVEDTEGGKYADIKRIDGKHFFIDGVHTVVGEVPMPTPCDLLEVDAIIAESFPEQVTLDFKVINNAEFCAEVITLQRFKVSATASEAATFKAMLQNRVIELNLIDALPGETPEDFELFIKG